MISFKIASLILAAIGIVNGAPIVEGPAPRGLESRAFTPGMVLRHDEVILYGAGRMEVVHRDVYRSLIGEKYNFHIDSEPQPPLPPSLPAYSGSNYNHTHKEPFHDASNGTHSLAARQSCTIFTDWEVDDTKSFEGWDVQLSQVGDGGTSDRAALTIGQGHSITQTVTVSAGVDLKFFKGAFGGSIGADYSKAWTSSREMSYTSNVTPGNIGAIVMNPWTVRRTGRILEGCIGAQKTIGTFMADQYTDKQVDGISWVEGTIRLCQKPVKELTRCIGQGVLR